jgi:hypothetical protein
MQISFSGLPAGCKFYSVGCQPDANLISVGHQPVANFIQLAAMDANFIQSAASRMQIASG